MLETLTEIFKSTTILMTDGITVWNKEDDSELEIQDYTATNLFLARN